MADKTVIVVNFYAPTEDPLFYELVYSDHLTIIPRVGEDVVVRIHDHIGSTTPEVLGRWIVESVVHNFGWEPHVMGTHDVAVYLRAKDTPEKVPRIGGALE